MQRISGPGTACCFHANDSVYFFLLLQRCGHLVKCASGVALVIEYACQLESGEILKRIRNSGYSIVQVTLSLNGDNCNVPFVRKERGHSLYTFPPGLDIIRSYVQNPFRARHIRIDAHYRDALGNRLVDICLEDFWSTSGEANSGGVLLYHLAEHSEFGVGLVPRRADQFGFYANCFSRIEEPRFRVLPIRQVDIRGHENIAFVFLVVGFCTRYDQRYATENENGQQGGPTLHHGSSPFAFC